MIVKQLIDEDFTNYKKASMLIGFSTCTFKCERECGKKMCQNSQLANSQPIDININKLIERYLSNDFTQAIVCGGLEPFDSFDDLYTLVSAIRNNYNCLDDIVIYTGYYNEEIKKYIDILKDFPNIIIKFGRYIPDQKSHYDDILGIKLASVNQYAERIS